MRPFLAVMIWFGMLKSRRMKFSWKLIIRRQDDCDRHAMLRRFLQRLRRTVSARHNMADTAVTFCRSWGLQAIESTSLFEIALSSCQRPNK